jgi:hypothetical protein
MRKHRGVSSWSLSVALLSLLGACSDDGGGESTGNGGSGANGSGNGGPGLGGSSALADFLEVTLDGQVLSIDPDPNTFSASSADYVNLGFETSLFDAAEMRLGNVVLDFGINKGVAGTYPLTDDSTDLNFYDNPLAYVELDLPDGTTYVPAEGSVTCDSVVMSPPDDEGRVRLQSVECTFEGMFEDEDDSTTVVPMSGRLVYAF